MKIIANQLIAGIIDNITLANPITYQFIGIYSSINLHQITPPHNPKKDVSLPTLSYTFAKEKIL